MGKAEKEKRRQKKLAEKRKARPALWEACKAKHGLTDEDVRKAKEAGLLPEKIISLPVKPGGHWKKPVKQWIGDSHEKMLKARRRRELSRERFERKQARHKEEGGQA